MNVLDFRKMKTEKRKISMVTCYDYWSAQIIARTDIDCILVGDSLAMVMHGYPSTLHATVEMMELHTRAVARGAPDKFIVTDMPFPTFRRGIPAALDCVDRLMKAGAHAIKLEGVEGHEDVVRAIVGSGVPVMGHLGLTPQSIHQFGGFRVQGREPQAVINLKRDAKTLQELGAFSVVLECVPSNVATDISQDLSIPTIGIGAGKQTDGQVLVLQDLLGMNPSFKPKFVRHFLNGEEIVRSALKAYHSGVSDGSFPTESESYT
jgi:3-methyl-2-oxobutanoate hydroxymethyltransferase